MTLIDTAMAAVVLGVTVRHVQRFVAQGDLTNHGNGRHIRLDLAEVSNYAARRQNPD